MTTKPFTKQSKQIAAKLHKLAASLDLLFLPQPDFQHVGMCHRQNEEEANQNPELAVQTTDTVLESLGDDLRLTERWHSLKSESPLSPTLSLIIMEVKNGSFQ